MATRRRSSRDPEPPVRPGCLLLLAGFVVIFILFYVNFDRIGGVLERNRVLEILTTRREAKPARNPVEPAPKIRDDTGGAGSSSSGTGKGSPSAPGSGGGHVVARDALVELGYSVTEAEQALAGVDPDLPADERVRLALRRAA